MSAVERPAQEIVTQEEVMATSREVFGQDNYGQLAIDILDRLKQAAWIGVRETAFDFDDEWRRIETTRLHASGLHHNTHPVWATLFTGRAARAASMPAIESALRETMGGKELFFDYLFTENMVREEQDELVAFMIPVSLSKEALARFMTRRSQRGPSLSATNLRGAVGRAFDILSVVSGVKDAVDPEATAIHGELVDYEQLINGPFREVTPSVRRSFRDYTHLSVGWQAHSGETWIHPRVEIAVEGNVRLGNRGVPIHFGVEIDRIAASSLRELREATRSQGLKRALADI